MRRLVSLGLVLAVSTLVFGCGDKPKDVINTEIKTPPTEPPMGGKGQEGGAMSAQQ